MRSKPVASHSVLVAVPVYEARVLPRFGAARDFVLAEVVPSAGGATRLEPRTWEPPGAPSLARWLSGLGVAGVICGGIHPRFVAELEAEGLWVLWGQRGEVGEVLRKWGTGEVVAQGASECAVTLRHGCASSGTTGKAPGKQDEEE